MVVTASLLLVWLFLLLAMWKNLANRLSQGWARIRGLPSKHKVPLLHTLPYYLAITRSSCEVKEYLSILKSNINNINLLHTLPSKTPLPLFHDGQVHVLNVPVKSKIPEGAGEVNLKGFIWRHHQNESKRLNWVSAL